LRQNKQTNKQTNNKQTLTKQKKNATQPTAITLERLRFVIRSDRVDRVLIGSAGRSSQLATPLSFPVDQKTKQNKRTPPFEMNPTDPTRRRCVVERPRSKKQKTKQKQNKRKKKQMSGDSFTGQRRVPLRVT